MLSLIRRRIGTVTAIVFMVGLLAVTSIASSGWSSSQTSSVSLSTLQLNTPSLTANSSGGVSISDPTQTDANGNAVTPTFTLQSSSSASGPWSTATTPPPNVTGATVGVGTSPEAVAYDSTSNTVWAVNYGSNTISVIDAATDAVITTIPATTGLASPSSIVYDPTNGAMYVANNGGYTVLVFNAQTFALTTSITVSSTEHPYTLAYDSSNNGIWVATNGGGSTLSVINAATNQITAAAWQGCGGISGLGYDPANDYMYVACWSTGNLFGLDASTGVDMANLTVGSYPEAVVYGGNGYVYVTGDNGMVWAVAASTDTVSSTITLSTPSGALSPIGAAIGPSGFLYVSVESTSIGTPNVFIINTSTNTVGSGVMLSLGGPGSAQGLAYDTLNNTVWVGAYNYNSVSVINAAAVPTAATVTVGSTPYGDAYDSTNNTVWVTNAGSNSVSIIDAANNTVSSTVSLGTSPSYIAYDPVDNTMWVTEPSAGTVAVIDAANNTVSSTVSIGSEAMWMAYDSATNTMWVTSTGAQGCTTGCISVISSSAAVVTTVLVGQVPAGITYDPVDNTMWVSSGTQTVSVYSGTTYGGLTSVTVTGTPAGLAYQDGDVYVASGATGLVSVINASSKAVITSIYLTATIGYVCAGNGYVYVTDPGVIGGVAIINAQTNTVAVISEVATPNYIAYDSSANSIYVPTTSTSGTVSAIQLPNGTPITGSTSTSYTAATPYSPTYFQAQASYDGWTSPWSAAAAS